MKDDKSRESRTGSAFLGAVTRNPISLFGAAVTTVSAMLILTLFFIQLFGHAGSAYVGIVTFLVLPGFFVLGLILIPVGAARERRRRRKAKAAGERTPRFPIIDLNRDRTRKLLLTFVGFTAINMVILATVSYKGVEVMESTEFCGSVCHTVMQPERTAHQDSPHSRVPCVDCHIGPGADWFVKSKLSGAWQLVSTTFDLYPRPIPTPIPNLRPARDSCEQCHWPVKFVGGRTKVITRFGSDEANTELSTALVMKVDGYKLDGSHGIHRHVDPRISIRYRSDPTRENIHEVELTQEDGTIKRFFSPDAAEADGDGDGDGDGEASVWRLMDCVDCHNRPTHIYHLPGPALDDAIADGRIPQDLPFVKREGLRLLQEEYESHDAARVSLAAGISAFYAQEYPELARERGDAIEQTGQRLGDLFARNVFPAMKVTWGTYPDHIGHETSAGCFRCHTDEHESEDGTLISQDCDLCHSVLAWDEEDPEALATLRP